MMKYIAVLLLLMVALTVNAQTYSPAEAKKHAGDSITICGLVTSAQFTTQQEGNPTYLGFGDPFPNQMFSVIIMETDLGKFAYNPADLKESKVCVKGKVKMFAGKPAIFVTDPSQVEKQEE